MYKNSELPPYPHTHYSTMVMQHTMDLSFTFQSSEERVKSAAENALAFSS
jgi:hypothetical protein